MGLFRRRGSREEDDDRGQNLDRSDPGYAAWFANVADAGSQPVPYKRPLTAPVYPQLHSPTPDYETDTGWPLDAPSGDGWLPADRIDEFESSYGRSSASNGTNPHISPAEQLPPGPPPTPQPTIPPRNVPMTSPPKHHLESPSATRPYQGEAMSNIDKILGELMRIDGASGAAVVDADSGMVLGMSGNPSFSLEYAGAGNSEVVRAKLRTMSNLGITDTLEDILITLSNQYHLIRVLETPGLSTLFVYLVLDRARANLALARHKLGEQTPKIEI
ncbi:roadblock/LC7 domain-containing protein [Rhodococcus erythropolis]|uniref:hypothetical protein n=1 Tax=Rhodococcus TaxID=1827 RepID=UPI000BB37208|nr:MULTISPECIES: hypothetical protein [unclassified Rhodococcus (in: high G+C Gram-positive bacteria)]NHP17661.1 roadblock/LC7 domain-containing protein [Rhodococcus sp. IC4_135]RQO44371.1 hypothetical protein DBV08_21025 [Rhodococcus sp. KBW08]